MVFIIAPERVRVAVTKFPAVTWTTNSLDACDVASVVMDWMVLSLSSYDMSDVTADPDALPVDGVVINDVLNKWTKFSRCRNELREPDFSPSFLSLHGTY